MVEPITATIRSTARSYLEILFHRKWLLILPVIFSTILAYGYSWTLTPVYSSEALIEVDESARDNPFVSRMMGRGRASSVTDRWRHILSLLKSHSNVEDIVRELNLHENVRTEEEFRALVREVRNNVSLSISGNLMRIRCTFTDPDATRDIVNIFAREFIKANLEAHKREVFSGEDIIRREAELILKEMEAKNAEIRELELQFSHLLPDETAQVIYSELGWEDSDGEPRYPPFQPEAIGGLSLAHRQYHHFSSRLVDYGLRLKELETNRAKIIEQLEGQSEYVVSERLSETNPIVRSLRDEKTRKQVELARLLVGATANHPDVQRLNNEVANLEKALSETVEVTVREEKATINPVYQALQMELSEIDRRISALHTRITITRTVAEEAFERSRGAPEKQQERARLRREANILRRNYYRRMSLLGDVELSQRMEFDERGTQFRVVDAARRPLRPSAPKKSVYIVGGFFFGLVLGAGLLVLAETTDHSFEEPNQLREFLPIPLLGATSRILTLEEQSLLQARKRLAILSLVIVLVFVIITISMVIIFGGG